MAYVSLYRKYRPQSFAEVVGQSHVTRTLANAIAEDRLAHAYLFTGPRGTGKTSTARILAKAVNCESGPTATPCQTCGLCISITDGSSLDVIELDMASHGGVDDARELRERALFAPGRARRKVYILDEVHMASTAAFNALLKLIEEPPAHVLFAMATTDPQKVIPTIMSRVQRLDLRRVPAEEIAAHVRRLAQLEGFTIDDAAVDAVVRAGDGSVRDTLSVLDQVRSYTGGDVGSAHVAEVLGHTPLERVAEAVTLIAARDLAGLLGLVQRLLDGGHDLRRFTLDLIGQLRDLLVLQVAPDRPDLVDATADRRSQLATQAGLVARETLVGSLELLAETLTEMRRGPARLPLELALARIATSGAPAASGAATPTPASPAPAPPAPSRPPTPAPVEPDPEPVPAPQPPPSPEPQPDPGPQPDPQPLPAPQPPPAPERPTPTPREPVAGDDLATIVARWPQVLDALRGSMRVRAYYLEGAPVALDRDELVLGFRKSFHAEQAMVPENVAVLHEALESVVGVRYRVRATLREDDETTTEVHAPSPVSIEEESDVLESEDAPVEHVDEDAAVAVLREQLGAEPVER